MAINYVPLDKAKHKDLKLNLQHDYAHTQNAHLAAATIREYGKLASCMPIVFIFDEKSGNHFSVAMLGLEQNANFFVKDGKWQGSAMPLNMMRYPFDVRPTAENQLGVLIDENSELFTEDGEALFTDAGEPTEFLLNRQRLLGELANSEMATQQFVKKVVELGLLEDITVLVDYEDGARRNMTGIKTINEKRLAELSDEQVLELHKSGFLGAIYTTLVSMGQLHRLIDLSKQTASPIRAMQVRATAELEAAQKAAEAEKAEA